MLRAAGGSGGRLPSPLTGEVIPWDPQHPHRNILRCGCEPARLRGNDIPSPPRRRPAGGVMRFSTLFRTTLSSLVMIGATASWAAAAFGMISISADGGKVVEPRLESRVEPVYPPEAHDAELEAKTLLQAMIGKDGSIAPETIHCLHCSVKRKGEEPEEVLRGWCDDFCAASSAAVARWRYRPATLDGEPVDVYFTIVVEFSLD